MTEPQPAVQPEAILEDWLRESDKERARVVLDRLVSSYAEPLIRRIVSFKLARSRDGGGIQQADVNDVCGTALYNLLARLERLKNEEHRAPVRNFSGYVAVTAYNAANEYFRAKKPAWLSLSMKLRYLVTHSPRLALWETSEGQEVCGFAKSLGRGSAADMAALREARDRLRQSQDPSRLTTSDLAEAILKAAGGHMVFDSFVEVAADWSGVKEAQLQSLDEPAAEESKSWELEDTEASVETRLIGRRYMEQLWREICDLPATHRKALLLNLNDSAGGDIELFSHLGIASVGDIAKAVEMNAVEFAELWPELPLDDTRIAQKLGIGRQDVVNRRSAARKRLIRRMKDIGYAK